MADDTPPPPAPGGPAEASGAPIPLLDIVDELRDSYLTYAQSVIVSRALPDVRDGLKPSQRRILVAMNDLGLGPTAATSKCAGIIGETMKRYHPHGDASIYDALVRLAQDWVLRYRLIHGQGNFGSIAGLPPAAHRYTEAKLSPVAAELLDDLDHETVDFVDNYDGKYREPLVLPARFPNLLVNGADGIAVGMATHIPPHNLREVCAALVRLIEDPDTTLGDLIQLVPGPDFPTGGIVMGRQGIVDAYARGRGKITLRARVDIVEEGKGKSPSILIREVPFQVSRIKLQEVIAELVKEERIAGISGVRDESSARTGEPVRIVIELKRGADPHLVLNQLYQFSPLQDTVSIILLAIVDGRPQLLTLKEMMQKFLDHRVQVIRRRTEYLLREAKRRGHVLEGQLIAIADIDEVIRICRTSPNRSEAKLRLQQMEVPAALMERAIGAEAFGGLQRELGAQAVYRMTELQAEAVVRLQLGQLAALESEEILKEYTHLREQIRGFETLLGDDANVRKVIRDDLEHIGSRFGDARKTEISGDAADVSMEDLIEDEQVVVSVSHQGFVKRMPVGEYRVQHRGGKGVQGGLRDDDFVEHFFTAATKDYLLCFTDKGQLYWLKVWQVPQAARTSPGRSIANVLSLKPEEKLSGIVAVREFVEGAFLLTATRKGLVKKSKLTDYSRPRAGGIIGMGLDDDDKLIGVGLTKAGDEVVLSSRNGMAIRFSEANIRATGRGTYGVKGINLVGDDELVGMTVADPDGFLLTVCELGYGKRTPFGANTADAADGDDDAGPEPTETEPEEGTETEGGEDRSSMRYRRQRRGGKGLRDVKVTAKNGKVVGVSSVRDGDEVILITVGGMVTRCKVDTIRLVGRNTQGVRVMNLNEGDKLATLAKVAPETVEPAGTAVEPA
ncbi:DNA gyrase subunit A [Urbifossiella limnaea]|uniref:DNA topoisomerase (ATP-hydrolyzing) n=1 Tax=Urbifossiella limnaea TaxID=2528023 RepID=A0A517XTI1_9BACT|nr:DNA gyrase subunit A [Urbifossiella limnaea]QDU20803.1 DNA gyrase subunit A [Urbifossiella limnaea]